MLNYGGWNMNCARYLQTIVRRFLLYLLTKVGLSIFNYSCGLAEHWDMEDTLWVELPEDWNGSGD